MTHKVLLAEGLDVLRQAETKEYEYDKVYERINGNKKFRSDMVKVAQGYHNVFQQFVRGLDILNYVRHAAMRDADPKLAAYHRNLAEFCVGKLNASMERSEQLLHKIDRLLLPATEVDQMTKDGFAPGEVLFRHRGAEQPLADENAKLDQSLELAPGSYMVCIKYLDDYTVAAPDVDAIISVTPHTNSLTQPVMLNSSIPCQMCTRKCFGVLDGGATLNVKVIAKGMRNAHVDVLVQRWESMHQPVPAGLPHLPELPSIPTAALAAPTPAATSSQGGVDSWKALERLSIPTEQRAPTGAALSSTPPTIIVNPAGLSCRDRLLRLGVVLQAWPSTGVAAVALPREAQRFAQSVFALPEPNDLDA